MYLIAYVISNSTIILIQLKNLIIWATGKFLKDPSREFSADSSDWCGRLWSGITLPEQPSKAKALHWDTWYSLLITLPPPGWVSYTSAKQLNSLDHILEASSSDAGFLWDFTNQVVQKTNLALYKNNPLLKDILSINGDVKMAGYWMFFLSLIHKGKEDNKNIRTQIKEASVEYFRRSSINTRYQKKMIQTENSLAATWRRPGMESAGYNAQISLCLLAQSSCTLTHFGVAIQHIRSRPPFCPNRGKKNRKECFSLSNSNSNLTLFY